ncbi:MAG: hypothetical protein V7788_14845 [Alphaproteobacteria bacterium]|jgi:hypothetical protein
MNKLRFVLPLALVAALALVGCRTAVPIENVSTVSYGSNAYAKEPNLTLTDYEKAIVRAGTYRGWLAKPVAPGHLEAANVIRNKHTVVVDILFNTETFSIDYKSSQNLDWNPATKTIHPNYNSWIELLEADIKAEIQRLRAS